MNCQKSSLREIEQIHQNIASENFLNPDYDEFETMLNSLAISLTQLSKNEKIREKVHELVGKKFDGDDNTLIKHLSEQVPNLATELINSKLLRDFKKIFKDSKMKSKSNFSSFSDHKRFDKIVSGYNSGKYKWFPQIYIPYFDVHMNNLNTVPTIAIVKDDNEIIPGYTLDENDNLIMIDVDHKYASKNLTWIVSVNERTNDKGSLLTQFTNNKNTELEQRATALRIRIGNITLYSPHESWGRSEISHITFHSVAGSCTHNGTVLNGQDFVETNNMNNILVMSETNGLAYLTSASSASPSHPNQLQIGECFDFILYERDPSNNSTETIEKYNNCPNGSNMVYFSYSGPYFHAYTVNNNSLYPMCLTSGNLLTYWFPYKVIDIQGEARCELVGVGI